MIKKIKIISLIMGLLISLFYLGDDKNIVVAETQSTRSGWVGQGQELFRPSNGWELDDETQVLRYQVNHMAVEGDNLIIAGFAINFGTTHHNGSNNKIFIQLFDIDNGVYKSYEATNVAVDKTSLFEYVGSPKCSASTSANSGGLNHISGEVCNFNYQNVGFEIRIPLDDVKLDDGIDENIYDMSIGVRTEYNGKVFSYYADLYYPIDRTSSDGKFNYSLKSDLNKMRARSNNSSVLGRTAPGKNSPSIQTATYFEKWGYFSINSTSLLGVGNSPYGDELWVGMNYGSISNRTIYPGTGGGIAWGARIWFSFLGDKAVLSVSRGEVEEEIEEEKPPAGINGIVVKDEVNGWGVDGAVINVSSSYGGVNTNLTTSSNGTVSYSTPSMSYESTSSSAYPNSITYTFRQTSTKDGYLLNPGPNPQTKVVNANKGSYQYQSSYTVNVYSCINLTVGPDWNPNWAIEMSQSQMEYERAACNADPNGTWYSGTRTKYETKTMYTWSYPSTPINLTFENRRIMNYSIEKIEAFTKKASDGLPIKVYVKNDVTLKEQQILNPQLTVQLNYGGVNTVNRVDNARNMNNSNTAINLTIPSSLLSINSVKLVTATLTANHSNPISGDIKYAAQSLATDGYTASESTFTIDTSINSTLNYFAVIKSEKYKNGNSNLFYESFNFEFDSPLTNIITWQAFDYNTKITYNNELGSNYRYTNSYFLMPTQIVEKKYLSYPNYDENTVIVNSYFDGSKYQFPYVFYEIETQNVFQNNDDDRIISTLISTNKWFLPFKMEIKKYLFTHIVEQAGINAITINTHSNIDVTKLAVTGELDIDQLPTIGLYTYREINPDNPFPTGVTNWLTSLINELKRY